MCSGGEVRGQWEVSKGTAVTQLLNPEGWQNVVAKKARVLMIRSDIIVAQQDDGRQERCHVRMVQLQA